MHMKNIFEKSSRTWHFLEFNIMLRGWVSDRGHYDNILNDLDCNRVSSSKKGRAITEHQGSTLAVFRYPEHPRFSDGIPDSPEQ